ncbi:uncharacterized protein LOC141853752 [Brevipalpus obovatus]|uniref:uncharacterized protein LOC141853752 n=1 Tax=Brevipalpus obovatus TaxID=246614 RepID=UPI003D9E1950
MRKLCFFNIRSLSGFFPLFLLSASISPIAFSDVSRLATNGHQNGPVQVPQIDLYSGNDLGLVYDPDEEQSIDSEVTSDDYLDNDVPSQVDQGGNVMFEEKVTNTPMPETIDYPLEDLPEILPHQERINPTSSTTTTTTTTTTRKPLRYPEKSKTKKKTKNKKKKQTRLNPKPSSVDDEVKKSVEDIDSLGYHDDQEAAKLKPKDSRERLEKLLKSHRIKDDNLDEKLKYDMKKIHSKGHKRHGWKNYYQKEEVGDENRLQKVKKDKEWKKRFASFKQPIVEAGISGHRTTLIVGKKGKKIKSSKKGVDQVSSFDKGHGVQIAGKRAKISLNGHDLKSKSKVKIGAYVKKKFPKEVQFDDDEDGEELRPRSESSMEKNLPGKGKEKIKKSLKIETKVENEKRKKNSKDFNMIPKPKSSTSNDQSGSVPSTWLLSQPILQARSRVIKAFLRGEI